MVVRCLLACLCFTLMLQSAVSAADSIVVDGARYDDVYITESTSLYIISFPLTGKTQNIPKSQVSPQSVMIDDNDAERKKLYQAWRVARGLVKVSPQPIEDSHETIQPEPDDPLELFKYKKALFETADFEAALEHWANLPLSIRRSLVVGIQQRASDTGRFFGSRLSNYDASRSGNNRAIASNLDSIGKHSRGIARHNSEEAREVDRAYNSYSVRFYEGMYESTYFRREAQLANGYDNPYTDITLDTYARQYDNELSKAAGQAAASNARHSSARANLQSAISGNQRAIGNLNKSNRRLSYLGRGSRISSAQTAQRAESKLSRIADLEIALTNEYIPYLQRTEVLGFGSFDGRTEAQVSISTDVWRLDFQSWGATGFYIEVFDESTGKPIARLDEKTPPHERFRVFDESGKFRIAAHAPLECEFEIHVYEVRD